MQDSHGVDVYKRDGFHTSRKPYKCENWTLLAKENLQPSKTMTKSKNYYLYKSKSSKKIPVDSRRLDSRSRSMKRSDKSKSPTHSQYIPSYRPTQAQTHTQLKSILKAPKSNLSSTKTTACRASSGKNLQKSLSKGMLCKKSIRELTQGISNYMSPRDKAENSSKTVRNFMNQDIKLDLTHRFGDTAGQIGSKNLQHYKDRVKKVKNWVTRDRSKETRTCRTKSRFTFMDSSTNKHVLDMLARQQQKPTSFRF